MRHLTDGTLRRLYDEPLALASAEQAHLDGCRQCQVRLDAIANDSRAIAALLGVAPFEAEASAGLHSLRQRIRKDEARPLPWFQRWRDRGAPRLVRLKTPLVAFALAALLVTGLALTGVSGYLLRIFEPNKVVGVEVSPSASDAANLRLDYGQITWLPAPPNPQLLSDAATAHSQTGLPILMPASLPDGVSGAVSYGVVSQTTGSLTFDANRLRASAASAHVTVSAMPAKIDGSTLVVNAGPALIEVWGLPANQVQAPTLVIAQTRVPTIDSSGASTTDLQNYLLSQPGVPPEFAAELKAIKDPSTTLPIPIPKGLATSDPIHVNGVQGLLIKAVIGAGVVWVKNGVIYAVGGQLTPDQVLAIATSLH